MRRRSVRVLWLGDSTAAGVGASSPTPAVSAGVGSIIAADRNVTIDVERDRQVGGAGGRCRRGSGAAGRRAASRRRGHQRRRQRHDPPDVGRHVPAAVNRSVLDELDGSRRRRVTRRGHRSARHGRAAAVAPAAPRHRRVARRTPGPRSHATLARDHGAHYVDLFAGTSSQFRADPDRYFAADNYHPSDAGYALWAKVIAPAVGRTIAP